MFNSPAPASAESLLVGLNPEQCEVVQHDKGPLLVGAVAGSGKTRALVHRIAYLVAVRGVEAARILALTFSKKAAGEMNERLIACIGESAARVGTFHSLGFEFIREEEIAMRNWTVDEKDRYRTIVKDALGFRGMGWDDADITTVMQFIGECKANCILPGTTDAKAFALEFHKQLPCANRTPDRLEVAYELAEKSRVEKQLITFDDMLLAMWVRLKVDANVLNDWRNRWDYVLQDECQDESFVQREIASMLSSEHGNYMMVGDPAQSIYAFRGSSPKGMLEFAKRARVIRMDRNYRCGSAIADVANRTLDAMAPSTHLGMTIRAERNVTGRVDYLDTADGETEALEIADRIRELHAGGIPYSDMVVLMRINSLSRSIEETFLMERIPYMVIGGTNFYDRSEVKSLLAYLRIAANRGTMADVRRCINSPFRFLAKAFVDNIERVANVDEHDTYTAAEWCAKVSSVCDAPGVKLQGRQRSSVREWTDIITALSKAIAGGASSFDAKPHRMLDQLTTRIEYTKFLTRSEGSESPENNRVSNVRELVRAAEKFSTVVSLLDYVDETMKKSRDARGQGQDRVTIMSIHRSKGLEFPAVFLVSANDGVLPHGRGDLEEERRLFYVACTRAKDYLHLSSVRQIAFGPRSSSATPSRFISEAGIAVTA